MPRTLPTPMERNSTFAFFILFIYTISVLIRPHEMLPQTVEWILIKVLAIICLLVTLAAQRPLTWFPQHTMLVLLLPLIMMSGLLNSSGSHGVSEAQKLLAASIIPMFLFTNLISSIKRQHWIMLICLVAIMLMIYNGHTQQSSVDHFGWALDTQAMVANDRETDVVRITYLGFFNDPNDIGLFLVMCIPFTVYFYYKGNFFTKLCMFAVLVYLGYGIYLTGSRGTQLGAISLIGFYYLITRAGPKLLITATIFAPIAAVIVTSLQSSIDESANGRLEAWYAGVLMMLASPLFGIGKGNFVDHHGLTAHNSYILILGELGVPGYSLWGGAVISTVLIGYLYIVNAREMDEEKLTTEVKAELAVNKAIFFSMIGFLVTAFFLSRSYTVLLFIFLGMALASHARLAKLLPELGEQCFNVSVAKKSMLYCWIVIITVYMTLKVGL